MEPSDDTLSPDASLREYVPSALDLVVVDTGHRLPLARRELVLGGVGQPPPDLCLEGLAPGQARLYWGEGRLFFANLHPQVEARRNGIPLEGGELAEGDELSLGGHLLRLVRAGFVASLECYSAPYRGRLWSLGWEPASIGRSGKRSNRVELNEPTISRAHATVRWEQEAFVLEGESGSSLTLVNGEPVRPGEPRRLNDQDLLRLGNLLLRFHCRATPDKPGTGALKVFSLGGLEIFHRGQRVADSAWRLHSGRYLLAYLAAEWPQPVAMQRLRELFWPDLDREQARKSLTWALASLREALPTQGAELLVRTAQTLQLGPGVLAWHDFSELRGHLSEGRRLQEAGQGEQALHPYRQAHELYRGPYLEECPMEWASRRRDLVESELVEAGVQLARAYEAHRQWDQAVDMSRRVLRLDPCAQEACLALMRGLRAQGRSQEAVRAYEGCRHALARELSMEPSIEMLREHELAQMNLAG